MLINNQIALMISIIPPIFGSLVTYTAPTIPTIDAKNALAPNPVTSEAPVAPNAVPRLPMKKATMAPIKPNTHLIFLIPFRLF